MCLHLFTGELCGMQANHKNSWLLGPSFLISKNGRADNLQNASEFGLPAEAASKTYSLTSCYLLENIWHISQLKRLPKMHEGHSLPGNPTALCSSLFKAEFCSV